VVRKRLIQGLIPSKIISLESKVFKRSAILVKTIRIDLKMFPPSPHLPASYAALKFQDIKISHVPESSSTPTAVLVITLNRPAKLNAFTDWTREELERVYALIDVDPRVRCVILTGAGKAFCAGFDLEVGFPGARDSSGQTKNAIKEREVDHRDS
jgi:hypothetical protein